MSPADIPEKRDTTGFPVRSGSPRWLLFLLVLFGTVPLLWPGDAPWINDEPVLIEMALRAKTTGDLPSRGLPGSKGVAYGPLPVWIYTALMQVTQDLVELARLRAALVTFFTGLSIFWLSRLLPHLAAPWGAVALLSPYLWIYSRQLWDNTFLIPISGLALAAYLSFCARPRASMLILTFFLAVGMVLTHLLSACLILPLVLHAIWFQRAWLIRQTGLLAVLACLGLALLWPYLREWTWVTSDREQQSALRGWIFPVFGGQMISHFGIEYFFGRTWYASEIFDRTEWILIPSWISYLALPLVWLGLGLAAATVGRGIRDRTQQDLQFHVCLLSLSCVIAQSAICGLMRTYGHPHYFNATWMIYWLSIWHALSLHPERPEWKFVRALYGISMGVVLAFLVVNIHYAQGNRSIHYGPTMEHQIQIAEELNRYHPSSPISIASRHYALFPHALQVIRNIYGWQGSDTAPLKRLKIEQRRGGRVEVRVAE